MIHEPRITKYYIIIIIIIIIKTTHRSVCGESFNMDHAMICRRDGFIIQQHNELRDLEEELLNIVCNDVQIEQVLQEVSGEALNPG